MPAAHKGANVPRHVVAAAHLPRRSTQKCVMVLATGELLKTTGVLFGSVSWGCLCRETTTNNNNKNNNKNNKRKKRCRRASRTPGIEQGTLAPSTAEDKEGAAAGLSLDSCGRFEAENGPPSPPLPATPRHAWLCAGSVASDRRGSR